MDENLYGQPYQAPAPAEKPKIRFQGRDWLTLVLSLALSVLFFAVFGLRTLFSDHLAIPAVGITAFVFAFYGVVFSVLGSRALKSRAGLVLSAGALLLALSCGLYADVYLHLVNCFVILALGAASVFALSGQARRLWYECAVLADTAALTLRALVSHFILPFRAIHRPGGRNVLLACAAVLAAIPLLTLVIWLLAQADAVFGGLLGGLDDWFSRLNAGRLIWRGIRDCLLALLIFSALIFIRDSAAPVWPRSAEGAGGKVPAGPALFILALLDLVCLVFCVIQFKFLFGGAEAAAMSGGYAEYARSGFFQLVGVAGINLAVTLAGASLCLKKGEWNLFRRLLQGLALLLLVLTAVILVSAVRRMALYISVYGLSLLRALTLWGMLNIAVGLVAAGIKLFLPEYRFLKTFLPVLLATWLVFCLCNIDARIADYNVDAYLNGRVEQMDDDYLKQLSPDTIPALLRLEQTGFGKPGSDALQNLREVKKELHWTEYSLSCFRYD